MSDAFHQPTVGLRYKYSYTKLSYHVNLSVLV